MSERLETPSAPAMRLTRRGALGVGLALAVCANRPGFAAEKTVRVGSVGGLTDAGLYLADDLGLFKKAGLAVSIEAMANGPTLLTALATDQLDVAGIAITPGLFAAQRRGIAIRIVGDKQSYRPGFAATRVVVRPDLVRSSDRETVAGLKGRKVAISARASTAFANVSDVLAASGLDVDAVDIVELSYPNMVAALSNGAVDAAYLIEPFLTQALRAKIAVELRQSNVSELGGPGGSRLAVPLVYSETFARDRPAAQAFMDAYVEGVRAYNDAFIKGLNKDHVFAVLAPRSGVDEATIRATYPAGLDPDQRVDVASVARMQDFFIRQKLLDAPADLSKLIDPSFAQAAVARLGPYR